MSSTEFKPESSPSLAGPSRKRPRSEVTSEERKEARAHRNRIAAQNSRDRRKAQFTYLERRVTELEDENKRLRAGLPPADPQQDAKDLENQELRARIVTLERGLEAVVKAFAVQGLPSSIPPTDISSSVKSSETTPSSSAEPPTPVLTPSLTSSPSSAGSPEPVSFPISPASSHASLDFSFAPSLPSASRLSPTPESESTRHLARVATTRVTPRVSLQRVNSNSTPLTSTTPKATILSPISQRHPWTPSMMRQWKLSSMKSSTATLAHLHLNPLNNPTQVQGQRKPRVYKLLIYSRLPDKLKGTRRRRRPPVTHRRK
ncbi:hypothetical protein E1B28_000412 [Marasmius oreades]|uniref:X-box-binding protein 1 n=1 Tax=Marasmius oreades TaxID=181124 RepID=A0A9P7V170_9AGAR|nr:uncharacterized protein E1B28_000412 [Marasmius oreades]KAG7098466.1 hypothetical protein E1B28_000412 [Marasmius oreades]